MSAGICRLRSCWPLVLACGLARAGAAPADEPVIPPGCGLSLVAKIPMPQMKGTWDHLTADASTSRLFLSAQEDHAVDVVDLQTNRPVHRISGFFNRPQGEYYVADPARLIVTNGRDGTCKILRGDTYELLHSIPLSLGADMIEYDATAHRLYVESGGTDSKRGPGKLTMIDPDSGAVLGEVRTGLRAAALAMETQGTKLYVAIPAANQIAVLDRPSGTIVSRLPVAGRPASLALDEADHRLFVATRTFEKDPRPARFYVFDTRTGQTLANLDSTDATENMFYDAPHHRIYTSSLEGAIEVYRQTDPDHYEVAGRIMAAPHAGTSQLIPELNRYCVALAPHGDQVSQVWVFSTAP